MKDKDILFLRELAEASPSNSTEFDGRQGHMLEVSCTGGRDVKVVLKHGDGRAIHCWGSHAGGPLSSVTHAIGPDERARDALDPPVMGSREGQTMITVALDGGVLERFDLSA